MVIIQFSSNDFEKVEQKMKELASQANTFERKEISKSDAIAYFTEKNDPYKLELIDGLEDGSNNILYARKFYGFMPWSSHTKYIFNQSY